MERAKQATLASDTIDICRELIRIPSVNYGGGVANEATAAEYVEARLTQSGIKSRLFESAPKRVSLVARIAGMNSTLPGMLLHGHLDVVPANQDDWTVDPFAGHIEDGFLWGRGAVDMKNMIAMILAAVRDMERRGVRPQRDILLAFLADEEAGSELGSQWLVDNHPELFAGCTTAVSEVGGFSHTLSSGQRVYLIQTAEKGLAWFRLEPTSHDFHAAATELALAASRIGNHAWPVILRPSVHDLLHGIGSALKINLPAATDELGTLGPMVLATMQNTANATILEGTAPYLGTPGQRPFAVFDGRFLPGEEQSFKATIKHLAGDEVKCTFSITDRALEADFSGELVSKMRDLIHESDPEAITLPYMLSGGTDNKAFSKLGMTCYGFVPMQLPADLDFVSLFHGADERVPIASLTSGAHLIARLLEEY